MKGELIINSNTRTYEDWGVSMGDGFCDALAEPLTPKEYVTNESRLEHGKRVLVNNPHWQARDVTLLFTLKGTDAADFRAKRQAFLTEIYKGEVTVCVPSLDNLVYKFVYTGKGGDYGRDPSGTFCKMALKFTEADPSDRPPYVHIGA